MVNILFDSNTEADTDSDLPQPFRPLWLFVRVYRGLYRRWPQDKAKRHGVSAVAFLNSI